MTIHKTVEAIEQHIAAPASSHISVLECLCLVYDSRCRACRSEETDRVKMKVLAHPSA